MQILYDIDKEVLQYGIIRNVLQPLIENYFAHGFDPSRQDNILQFRGYIRDEDTYVLTVEDNGFGMEEDALQTLNAPLQEPPSRKAMVGKICPSGYNYTMAPSAVW